MDWIIYGKNPVREAIDAGKQIEKIFLQREMTGEFETYIRNHCKNNDIPLSKVPDIKLDKLSKNKNHQGCVAFVSKIRYYTIDEVFSFQDHLGCVAVILDGVTDVRNMGAIARSALAFEVKGIIVTSGGSVSLHEDAIKSSSGALLQIPVCREKNVMIAIEKLQQLGYKVLATDARAKQMIHDFQPEGPVALILGSEDRGVSREAKRIADESIGIVQSEKIDSLNVSVSAGIFFYELYKWMQK